MAAVAVATLLQLGVAADSAADRGEHPDRLHRNRLVGSVFRLVWDGSGQLPQCRVEQYRVDAVLGVIGDLVGQRDLGTLPSLLAGGRALRRHVDVGHRVAGPVATGRAGLDLNPIHVRAQRKLCGDAGLGVQDQRPLDGECADLYTVAERLGGGSQRHLGETGCRDDGLATDGLIGQPRQRRDTDVGLPDVLVAGRQFDVRTQQRVDICHVRDRAGFFSIQ